MPTEIIVIIVTLIHKSPRPKILCGHHNSGILYKNKLYAWGNIFPFQNTPQKILSNGILSLFTFQLAYLIAYTIPNEISIYNCGALYSKHKIDLIKNNILGIRKIICGDKINLILTTCNKVYTWSSVDDRILLEHIPILFNDVKNIGFRSDWADIVDIYGKVYTYHVSRNKFNFSTEQPISNIIKLSHGSSHVIAIDKYGNAYTWGSNGQGQLGLGDHIDISGSIRLSRSGIMSASCGYHHTIVLTNRNEIFGCGSNFHGQLGLGIDKYESILTKINIEDVISVSCGLLHTMVLTLKNKVYVFGSNMNGQLGLNNRLRSTIIYDHPQLLNYPFDWNT